MMKRYRLGYVLHTPSEDTDGMYMAEIPVLPGCRAWANSPQEVRSILESVAEEFIASYAEHGDPLPAVVVASASADGEFISSRLRYDRQYSEGASVPEFAEESIFVAV